MDERNGLKAANEIVLQNNVGQELNLIKTAPNELKSHQFQELLTNSEIMGGAVYGLNNLSQTINLSAEGLNLFSSTAPITQLKNYCNQLVSSMVKGEGGKIIWHAGFK